MADEQFRSPDNKTEYQTLYREVARAKDARNLTALSEAWRALAEQGDGRGAAEYGAILESEGSVKRSLALYRTAAEKGDAKGALYLAKRIAADEPTAAAFLISYAAVMGVPEAYLPLASLAKERGEGQMELYYLTLAALADNEEAACDLAYRYAEGDGVTKNPGVAKWYLLRLGFSRFKKATKLALALRRIEAEYPETPAADFLERFSLDLIAEADKLGYARMRYLLTKARADRGDAEAAIQTILDTVAGDGTEKDPDGGVAALEKMAKDGSALAYLAIGDLFVKGGLVERDTQRAMRAYTRAAELGAPEGYRKLGDLYRDTGTTGGGAAYALNYYEKAERLGDGDGTRAASAIRAERDALIRDGRALVETDPEEALRLFSRASQMGDTSAEILIADMYLSGMGVKVDKRRAFYGYTAAAEAGVTDAYFPLGLCYARGVGTKINTKKATYYLHLARENGNNGAEKEEKRILDRKLRHMRRSLYAMGVELIHGKKRKLGAELVYAAAERGEVHAMYTAGAIAEFGIGRVMDLKLAAFWYARAAEAGFTDERAAFKKQILHLAR